jgi:hypothetical protein
MHTYLHHQTDCTSDESSIERRSGESIEEFLRFFLPTLEGFYINFKRSPHPWD